MKILDEGGRFLADTDGNTLCLGHSDDCDGNRTVFRHG